MNLEKHPHIHLEQPAPGHYVVTGHKPANVANEKGQTVCPLDTCYIAPEVPSEVLFGILEDRGDFPPLLKVKAGEGGEVDVTAAGAAYFPSGAPNPLDVIQAEFPAEVEADTPEQIAALIRALFERNVTLTARCEELEDRLTAPPADESGEKKHAKKGGHK